MKNFSSDTLARKMFPHNSIEGMEMSKEDLAAAAAKLNVESYRMSNGKELFFYVTMNGFVADADLSSMGSGFNIQDLYVKIQDAVNKGLVTKF